MSEIKRRALLRLGLLSAVMAGGAVGTVRLAAGEPAAHTDDVDDLVDEVYRGRHILAFQPAPAARSAGRAWVYIDGVELHVMALEDGRYTTVMNHYHSFGTVQRAARAAVDNLRGAALLPHS